MDSMFKASIFDKLISSHNEISTDDDYEQKITRYLQNLKYQKDYDQLTAFSKKLNEIKKFEWLNSSGPIDLNGKLIIIDFWTYCCVNCMHIIPILNKLEQEFKNIVVIGVHSSKFPNEKLKSNILNATRRHLIRHPVVLDFNLDIWNMFEITCWPTIFVVNPEGIIISIFQGEIQANFLNKFIPVCLKFYENSINISINEHFQLSTIESKISSFSCLNQLLFPSKTYVDQVRNSIFISDSGNNRIISVNISTRQINFIIGSGKRGLLNGTFENSEFDWPQGLAFDSKNQRLYIADTFNDTIRVADLNSKNVTTLCGATNKNIGNYDLKGGKLGTEQTISTPWDLCFIEKSDCNILLISCTGTHQIWLYAFKTDTDTSNLKWWNNVQIEWNTLIAIAGNGKERNKNNLYPLQASFAQPSGLCMDNSNNIYIADAESSSIRVLNLDKGHVKNIAGGDLEPDNLFAFGDCDGIGFEAKLQHPLDVAYAKDTNHLIIVDTYNSALKKIDLKTKNCQKLKNKSGIDLNEPSGIFIHNQTIWIADSNNHSIKFIDNFDVNHTDYVLKEFNIIFKDDVDMKVSDLNLIQLNISKNKKILIKFDSNLNEQAENICKITHVHKNKTKKEFNVCIKKIKNENLYILENFYLDIDDLHELTMSFHIVICVEDKVGSKMCKMLKISKSYSKKDLGKLIDDTKSSKYTDSLILHIKK